MNKFNKLLAALALTAFAGVASAAAITGSIGFTGAYTHDGTDLNDATTITITSAEVQGVTSGSFLDAGIVDGTAATYSDFVFDPVSTPIANIWSVGVFTFELTSMSVDFQSGALLALSGKGTFSTTDNSLDDAFGDWTFTANETGSNLTWSSSAAVPEPAIILLLATG